MFHMDHVFLAYTSLKFLKITGKNFKFERIPKYTHIFVLYLSNLTTWHPECHSDMASPHCHDPGHSLLLPLPRHQSCYFSSKEGGKISMAHTHTCETCETVEN